MESAAGSEIISARLSYSLPEPWVSSRAIDSCILDERPQVSVIEAASARMQRSPASATAYVENTPTTAMANDDDKHASAKCDKS